MGACSWRRGVSGGHSVGLLMYIGGGGAWQGRHLPRPPPEEAPGLSTSWRWKGTLNEGVQGMVGSGTQQQVQEGRQGLHAALGSRGEPPSVCQPWALQSAPPLLHARTSGRCMLMGCCWSGSPWSPMAL